MSVYVEAAAILGSAASLDCNSVSDLPTWRLSVWPPRCSSRARLRRCVLLEGESGASPALWLRGCVHPHSTARNANKAATRIHRFKFNRNNSLLRSYKGYEKELGAQSVKLIACFLSAQSGSGMRHLASTIADSMPAPLLLAPSILIFDFAICRQLVYDRGQYLRQLSFERLQIKTELRRQSAGPVPAQRLRNLSALSDKCAPVPTHELTIPASPFC